MKVTGEVEATESIGPGFRCKEKEMGARTEQRSGNYWVFYNYIRAERTFRCNETITYTTHGEYTFLHNLEPLLKRWQGPISVSIYTPGDDYMTALKAIYYYRDCLGTSLIKDFVTFHFYFPYAHMTNSTFLTQEDLGNYFYKWPSPHGLFFFIFVFQVVLKLKLQLFKGSFRQAAFEACGCVGMLQCGK